MCLQTHFGHCWAESRPIAALSARGRAPSPAPSRPPCARTAAAPALTKAGLKTRPRLARLFLFLPGVQVGDDIAHFANVLDLAVGNLQSERLLEFEHEFDRPE